MSLNRKQKSNQHRLTFESLEFRSLLSGFHAVEPRPLVNKPPAIFASSVSRSSSSAHSETHLSATLTDPAGVTGVTGSVQFESETERGATKTELSVRVKGATAGAVVDVTIDNTSVGKITVGADGTGSLKLKSGVVAAEGSVVNLSVSSVDTTGATITTVLATGKLAARTSNPGGGGGSGDHGGSEQNEIHLSASYTDPATGLSLKAGYESETERGATVNKLGVSVTGAVAGSTIDVSLADATGKSVSVGTIKVDANGKGTLVLKTAPAPGTFTTLQLSTVNADNSLTPLASATFSAKR